MSDNKLTLPCEVGDVSDGYHTFNELYEHRHLLFLLLVTVNKPEAFKTRKDDRGEEMEGWFILGLNTNHGQITYHLPEKYWHDAEVQAVERNEDYDGHTAQDVLERLDAFLREEFEIPF